MKSLTKNSGWPTNNKQRIHIHVTTDTYAREPLEDHPLRDEMLRAVNNTKVKWLLLGKCDRKISFSLFRVIGYTHLWRPLCLKDFSFLCFRSFFLWRKFYFNLVILAKSKASLLHFLRNYYFTCFTSSQITILLISSCSPHTYEGARTYTYKCTHMHTYTFHIPSAECPFLKYHSA